MEKQELVITDLQFEDAGLYECRGHNGRKKKKKTSKF
jgi:hypothetical protein